MLCFFFSRLNSMTNHHKANNIIIIILNMIGQELTWLRDIILPLVFVESYEGFDLR